VTDRLIFAIERERGGVIFPLSQNFFFSHETKIDCIGREKSVIILQILPIFPVEKCRVRILMLCIFQV
jgi:hypothetical protein